MTSDQRKKAYYSENDRKGIEVGSGVLHKTYSKESKEVNELIMIANCFPELRNKNKTK